MSDLAFTATGEVFDVPPTTTGWRVRRLKPRGAPELVYGRDGCPLVLPIAADMTDLREAVDGVVGKYRLDPIGSSGKAIEDVPSAYVHVVEAPPEPVVPAIAPDDPYGVLKEAMRLNNEIAKTMVERFPEMLRAAAELVRAAESAGLPARRPRVARATEQEQTSSLATFLGPVVEAITQTLATDPTN
jgi:hypothetical protein